MSAITSEIWWQREIVTDELDEACDAIAAGLGVPRANIGTKGNEAHDSGSHRSQEWLLNSDFCDDRTYTVQSGLTDDQKRHIAGIDIVPGEWGTVENRRKTAEITARVIAAMKAGLLDEVFEVYGAAPDLKTVTGYNNRENRSASSDDSHLDHPHLGCDRRKMRDRAFLARLVAIILGDDMALTDKLSDSSGEYQGVSLNEALVKLLKRTGYLANQAKLVERLERIETAALDDDDTTVVLDPAALAEFRAALADLKAALPPLVADAVNDDAAARLAD